MISFLSPALQDEQGPIMATMTRNRDTDKITSISRTRNIENYALIPTPAPREGSRRLKKLQRSRGNCRFAAGVPKGLMDFIYRSVLKLGLREKKLIFSRGSVKINGLPSRTAVGLCELDWDIGTSVRIPRSLRYDKHLRLVIDGKEHSLRVMEVIVLHGLLKLATGKRSSPWLSAMAASIIAQGWPRYEQGKPAVVCLPEGGRDEG